MKKVLLTDYISFIALKALGPFFRFLPRGLSLFIGRRLGDLTFALDLKHRAVVYANLRQALGDKFSPHALSRLARNFYRNLGQNLIEVFFIPRIDQAYIKKYISFEGLEHAQEAFKDGKGAIFVSVHAGSWELSSIITSNLGIPFSLLVRDQRYPKLESLLNSYRSEKGCRFIQRQNQLREIIRVLKNNESIGMSLDQGGKAGEIVDFFGKEASMASGAVKLALKYGCSIVPVFYTRLKGSYIKTIIGSPYKVRKSGDEESDVRFNLQELVRIFEGFIRQYPQEYLWTYKIWKYGRLKRLLILSDSKAGHLRQSEAVAKALKNVYARRGIRTELSVREVHFKNRFARFGFTAGSLLSGKYSCQGCLACFLAFLQDDTRKGLFKERPDVVISAGSRVAAVNFILSRENNARSICVMRPGILGMGRFDAVLMPRHDNPPRGKNIGVTDGALNMVDGQYLEEAGQRLLQAAEGRLQPGGPYIGLLLGGDTKGFLLKEQTVRALVSQLKEAAEELNASLLVTTSRRTPKEAESLLKEELDHYPRCGLLVVASENNSSYAVGGILALSRVVVVSPESISMVSEAASSGKQVVVFDSSVGQRHRVFLRNLAEKKFIRLTEARKIVSAVRDGFAEKAKGAPFNDREGIERFLEGRL